MSSLSKKYIYQLPQDSNHPAKKVLHWLNEGSEILEVGCASGVQSKLFKETLNCRITGIEINEKAAKEAEPYCERVITGDIGQLDLHNQLGKQRFDYILFIDVLEHIYDPVSVLKKISPFLKENGSVIASIPNIAHASICWELAHGRFDYREFGLLDNTHIRFFTKKSIMKLFIDAGFHINQWERIVKLPNESEFNIHCNSSYEEGFLDWISHLNPECNTYQFIVKAQINTSDEQGIEYQNIKILDQVAELKTKIGKLKQEKNNLRSQLNWLEANRFGPISKLINKLISKLS